MSKSQHFLWKSSKVAFTTIITYYSIGIYVNVEIVFFGARQYRIDVFEWVMNVKEKKNRECAECNSCCVCGRDYKWREKVQQRGNNSFKL